jgi:FixJ family two-component response regulator
MNSAIALIHESTSPPQSCAAPIVFVVDDDPSVRASLESLICSAGWHAVTFATAQDFLAHPRVRTPSCLVLDLSLPDLNGLELQRRIGVDRIDMPIIFITGRGSVPVAVKAVKAGASEFLTKPFRSDVLLRSIRLAIEGSCSALRHDAAVQTLWDRYASLSGRERQVMKLLVRGKLNKQVGGELGISEITVKAHRGRMMQKMQAGSFASLVRLAARLGLGPVPKD